MTLGAEGVSSLTDVDSMILWGMLFVSCTCGVVAVSLTSDGATWPLDCLVLGGRCFFSLRDARAAFFAFALDCLVESEEGLNCARFYNRYLE